MGGFFNVDNALFRTITKIIDCIVLSFLWLLFSIPVFTIGAASSGLYYAVNKNIRHGRGYATSEFWHGFASNFKSATPIWLLSVFIYAFMGIDFVLTSHLMTGTARRFFMVVFIVVIILVICWNIYTFAYVARFENTRKVSMGNAARLAIAELPWTVLILVLFVTSVLLVYLFFPFVFVVPGVYTIIQNHILERIFLKYMSEEDKAAELERNRDFAE